MSTYLITSVAHLKDSPWDGSHPYQVAPKVVLGHGEVEPVLVARLPHVVDVGDVFFLWHGRRHPFGEVEMWHRGQTIPHRQRQDEIARRLGFVVEGQRAQVAQQLAGCRVVMGLKEK